MRKNLFSLAIIASALTLTAHADTIDDFTLTGDSHTITYSLPSTVDFPNFSLFNFFSQSAPTTIDGVSSDETGLYYDTSIFPRVSLILSVPDAVFGDPSLYLLGPSFIDFDFFSPSEGAATFVPGTYTLQSLSYPYLYPFSPPVSYTLTITPETTPSVPEPSSLSLLAIGAFGLAGLFKAGRSFGPKPAQI